ncbi:MAG: glycosyltransferase family 2 protein [Flavobacteriales bacterium]|nr:glycosyltransferase family 2 protein [Flavobacteriales bacterium]MBP9081238.1 glycosyltransferase family 2 protein [Flavobacteriales bacterium]
MSATPTVTVLMTLYNKGPYVEEAVHSVLAQTFADFQLLIVDDASTDGGLDKVKAILDPRIRILESAVNTGRAAAANRGLDAATGDYIAVLDADDTMHPARLAKQVAYLEAHPGVGAVGSWACVLHAPQQLVRWPADDGHCRALMLFGVPVSYGLGLLRRSTVEQHRLRCDAQWRTPGMDYLFMLQIGRHACYANLQEPLCAYRMGANNMRHGRDERDDWRLLVHETFRFFGLPASAEELELHLAFHGQWAEPFNAGRTRQLWAWKNKLAALARERGLFSGALFEAELDRRWGRLFHRFADHDLGAAWAHLRCSGQWPADRLMYLLKTTLSRWGGRKR